MSRARSAAVALLAMGAALLVVAPRADAANPAPDQSLSSTTSSMYQTNGKVYAITVSDGVVYAGGTFTAVRPPGAASGTNQTTRTYLAAFNASTGVVTSFNTTLNGQVRGLSVSPDGTTLYVAGSFTTANGSTRNRFAAFNTSTGALTSWNPNASGPGYSVLATASRVYVGGSFSRVGGLSRRDLAAVDPTTGTGQSAFSADADGIVYQMAVNSPATRLLVTGAFDNLGTQAWHGAGSIDPETGAAEPWSANGVLPDTDTCTATGKDVVVSGDVAFFAGEGAQPGCFDGDFAVNITAGTVKWENPCEGATQALEVVDGVLYKGSHMHDCAYNDGGAGGGFTGAWAKDERKLYHLIAQDPADGSFIHWNPDTNGSNLGPLAMATDGTQLFVAGDFSTVNKSSQQGLARFAPGTSTAPTKPSTAATPVVSGARSVTVTFPAVKDTDNGTLTYRLYRNGAVIATLTAESWPWATPTLRYTDTGLTVGTNYHYSYTASDGTTTTAKAPTSVDVAATSTAPTSLASAITASAPAAWWPLSDTDSTASDQSGNARPGSYVGGTSSTTGPTGAAARTLDGASGYVTSQTQRSPSASFSESVWVRTSTLDGGALLGFTDQQTGSGGNVDRVIWMDDDGQVVFAMNSPNSDPGGPSGPASPPNTVVRSANSYNDGRWHQVVATFDDATSTMTLYVDGASVGTATDTQVTPPAGYWRVGYVDLSSFNNVFGFNVTTETSPRSFHLDGSVAQAAFHDTVLSPNQVATQWAGAATAP